ncbi:MAG: hypothetical protein GWO24_29870, partial [Akkermansiaceae bacterium]|nr:hypothetical protein [Akkermansiaceae bacterium]
LRHYRGTGGGGFEVMGDLPRLALADPEYAGLSGASEFPKPVYTLKTIRSRDGERDDLVVMHAKSDRAWMLGT